MADYTLKCTGEQLDAAVEKANSAFVALDNKLNKDDVYDGLDSEDASKALSARQGKILKDNWVPYTGATKDIDIGFHVFTVGSESSVYTEITPSSIKITNPQYNSSISPYSLRVNGTTIYWPTVSADPNGKYLALRSDIPSIDDHLSATSTNAVQNKVVNSSISELSYQLAMVRENLFQTVLSEIDYTEDFATLYLIPDTLSDTDGTHRVLFSETQLREVAGNSIAYNQLSSNDALGNTVEGITMTNNGDGSFTLNGTATADSYIRLTSTNIFFIKGRKYLFTGMDKVATSYTTDQMLVYVDSPYTDFLASKLVTIDEQSTRKTAFFLLTMKGVTFNNLVIRPQLFDLTLMGLDSVSTVEEARTELLKRGIDIDQYNPFSEGEIRNTTASGIKLKYYNLLNINSTKGTLNGSDYTQGNKQNFEEGKYYDSLSINDYVLLNTIENIKVEGTQITFTPTSFAYGLCFPVRTIPNKSYNLEITPVLNPHPSYKVVMWYDDSGSYIRSDVIIDSESIIAPINGYWGVILLRSSGDNVTCSYKDICFHLSTLRTGYAPYKEPKAISFASTELLGAGEAHDTIEVVEGDKVAGIQRYNLIKVKRIGVVDLGTLSWNVADISTNRSFVHFPGAKLFDNDKVANIVSARFKADTYNNVGSNTSGLETISLGKIGENSYLYVKTSLITASTDTTEKIKTAMSGIALNYELATPTRTTIAENLTFEEVSATIEQGGSIETVYETLAPNCTTGFVVKKAKE